MCKLKKILLSLSIFNFGIMSNVYVAAETINNMPIDCEHPEMMSPTGTVLLWFFSIGKIIIPTILFIIGLLGVLNKISSKKVIIIIFILIGLTILNIILMNYLISILK